MNIEQYYRQLTQKLTAIDSDTAQLDARFLICHYLKLDYTSFILQQADIIADPILKQLQAAEKLALAHMPISRILKSREFWGLEFVISADVLDPRADSEILIETLLHFIPPSNQPLNILDLGTGTGCLLLSLLSEYINSTGIGIDYSEKALKIANINATNLKLKNRCEFIKSNWFDELPSQKFDIIISNPPYIPSIDINQLDDNVKLYDPLDALDGGLDGFDPYHIIARQAANYLKPNGILIFEMGYDQADTLFEILHKNGFHSDMFEMQQIASQQNLGKIRNGLGYDLGKNPRIIISKHKSID
ncbi:MAG: peptide chain release factor N(5)-glutamine methyltransferase [Rhizobiales bacterium]|nr:peptide chain release factor N(5)-glutamine methyltransferase [Hyphomicrobiales bacterium]